MPNAEFVEPRPAVRPLLWVSIPGRPAEQALPLAASGVCGAVIGSRVLRNAGPWSRSVYRVHAADPATYASIRSGPGRAHCGFGAPPIVLAIAVTAMVVLRRRRRTSSPGGKKVGEDSFSSVFREGAGPEVNVHETPASSAEVALPPRPAS